MKKAFIRHYLLNKYSIIGAVVLIIILFFSFRSSGNSQKIEFAVATIGNVTERVSVTGKIYPVDKADLAFQKGGVIKSVFVKVGDKVKKGSVLASLDSAGDAANLASAQAKLDDLKRSLNPQEYAVEKSKVTSAEVALANVKQDALNAVRAGYVQAQTAVNNYADSLFYNPQSVNPNIKVRTQSQGEQSSINNARIGVREVLSKWKSDIDSASPDSVANLINPVNGYVNTIDAFMGSLSTIVNNLNTDNSGLSQSVIDSYISSVNAGLASSNQAISSVNTAKTSLENASSAYEQANNNFQLKETGSSAQTIAAQAATVAAYKAEYDKDKVVSPIDGIVTLVDPSVGEFVSVGKTSFGVMSDEAYKIEAFVAESDIAKITVGNIASTTLDAYGQNVDFPAKVIMIDPAETILEGVPTYKVTLQFIESDSRIRSGMTANLNILTRENENVLFVPTRSVVTDTSGAKTVRLLNSDGKTYISVPVVVGLKGSEGTIEIVSGLNVGDKVVTYVK